MNISPCSRAKASPSSFFTSLRDSKSLQEINWGENENKIQMKEETLVLKESRNCFNGQLTHKEYRSYVMFIGLLISVVSRKIFFRSMSAAAWLRISYSITKNSVYKWLDKLIVARGLCPVFFVFFFFQMRSSESKGKKMNGKFQLSERRKVIDVPSHRNECLPPSLEAIHKKRESQE